MSKADELKDKNYIIEMIQGKDCTEANIFFYKDKTIGVINCTGKSYRYIDMEILKKMYEVSKELGWLDD